MDYEVMTLGTYGGEPIEWLVVEETDCNYWLIAKKALDTIPFHREYCEVDWEHCYLRRWLGNEFFDTAFTADEQDCIDEAVYYNVGNPKHGVPATNDTIDRVTIPSIQDVKVFLKNKELRKCEAGKLAIEHGVYVWPKSNGCNWWLRSPGVSYDRIAIISTSGYLKEDTTAPNAKAIGVRPMIAIYK